jgi:predicted ATPase/class 3 adenylate cyclase
VYVPRVVAEWGVGVGPEHHQVDGSLLFVDLSGFTSLSERLARLGRRGSEEVTGLVNRYFEALLGIAYQQGGDLLKFGGDALLLLFRDGGDPTYAAAAAARMQIAMERLGTQRTPAGEVRVRMAAGLHSGTIDLFLAGTEHRELVVTGPAATATIEMQHAARPGQILVSDATAARLPARVLGSRRPGGRLLRRTAADLAAPPSPTPKVVRDSVDVSMFVPAVQRALISSTAHVSDHRHVTTGFIRFSGTDKAIAGGEMTLVASRLHRLVVAAQEESERFGVTVMYADIDSDGGKLIIAAGAPNALEDADERLLLALHGIASRDLELPLQIGAAHGPVFAGAVGASFRRVFTIMGDSVNLAARLMARAAPGELIAATDVVAGAGSTFDCAPLEPFLVKGKRRPVDAVRVAGMLDAARPHRSDARLPLVGRDRELRVITQAGEQARGGRGVRVRVIGEAGLGKSRLIEEVIEGASQRVLVGRLTPYDTLVAYHGLNGILRQLVGIQANASAVEAGTKLTAFVTSRHPGLRPWLPMLATIIQADVAMTPEAERTAAAFRRQRSHESVLQLLAAEAREAPILIVIEDVHWLDEASRELLEYLSRRLESEALGIVTTERPAGDGSYDSGPGDVIVRLGPIDAAAAAVLVAQAGSDVRLPPQMLRSVMQRSEGNPLFLLELARALARNPTVDDLPVTVEGLLAARIDRLPPDDRALLRQAAVLGMDVDTGLLREVVEADLGFEATAARWRSLDEFLDEQPDGSLRFRHALIHDAAYASLPYRRRSALHDRIGRLIEARAQPSPEQAAEVLSLHFSRAGRNRKTWRYSLLAAERARARYAVAEAVEYYRRALGAARYQHTAPSAQAQAWESLGDALESVGDYDASGAAYARARALASAPLNEARLLRKQGELRERRGGYSQAVRWYGRSLARLGSSRGEAAAATRAGVHLAQAGVRLRQGRHRLCVAEAERALDAAERAGDRRSVAHAYYLLDAAYTNLGDDRAQAFRDLALPIFHEIGDLVMEGRALNNLGYNAAFAAGRWREGLEYFERALEAKERSGDLVSAALTRNNIAEILSDQGHLERAEALLHEVLAVWGAAGYKLGIATATSNLGRLLARRGDYTAAAEQLNAAAAQFEAMRASEGARLQNEARIAELDLIRGEFGAANQLASAALERCGAADPFPGARATFDRIAGLALLQMGRRTEAVAGLERSLTRAEESALPFEAALAKLALARAIAVSDGRRAASLERRARSEIRRLDVRELPAFGLPRPASTDD